MNKYKSSYKDMPNEDVPARQSRILGVILIALALLTVAVQTDTGEIDITAAIDDPIKPCRFCYIKFCKVQV